MPNCTIKIALKTGSILSWTVAYPLFRLSFELRSEMLKCFKSRSTGHRLIQLPSKNHYTHLLLRQYTIAIAYSWIPCQSLGHQQMRISNNPSAKTVAHIQTKLPGRTHLRHEWPIICFEIRRSLNGCKGAKKSEATQTKQLFFANAFFFLRARGCYFSAITNDNEPPNRGGLFQAVGHFISPQQHANNGCQCPISASS